MAVQQYACTSHYQDLLNSHRLFMDVLSQSPAHVLTCMDTRNVYLHQDGQGKRKLTAETIVQQPDVETYFDIALGITKQGLARVIKDETQIFATEHPFTIGLHHGALLHDWRRNGEPVVLDELQYRIDRCITLGELLKLLFEVDIDDLGMLTAFTKRRLELDADNRVPTFEVIHGGGLL